VSADLPGSSDPIKGNTDPVLPSGRRIAFWDGSRALLFFVFSAFASILLGVLLIEPIGFYGSVVIAEIFGFALTPWILSRVFATEWERWLAPARVPAAFWGWAILAVIGFAVVQSNIPVFLDRLFPIPMEQFEMYRRYLSAGTTGEFILFILVAAVVPAFCEEIAFRGVIQTGLRNTFGPKYAVIWTGFLFALLHMNPWNFPGLWAFGCLLGYLTERSGSIRPAILIHLANNTLALAVFALQSPEDWLAPLEFIPWYWTVVAGALLILALLRLHWLPLGPETDLKDPSAGFSRPGYD
jgi:membrane protease YdiL (CAAX protease family)